MTPAQTKLIHVARRSLGLEESWYREILRKIGGVDSSTQLSNAGFERVMAFFESRGFTDSAKPPTYWRDRAAARDHLASTQQVHLIRRLAPLVERYPLEALCRKFSDHRTEFPERLNPHEAKALIEMLKAVEKRQTLHHREHGEHREEKLRDLRGETSTLGGAKDAPAIGKEPAQGCAGQGRPKEQPEDSYGLA